jgi:hypothetical protein
MMQTCSVASLDWSYHPSGEGKSRSSFIVTIQWCCPQKILKLVWGLTEDMIR